MFYNCGVDATTQCHSLGGDMPFIRFTSVHFGSTHSFLASKRQATTCQTLSTAGRDGSLAKVASPRLLKTATRSQGSQGIWPHAPWLQCCSKIVWLWRRMPGHQPHEIQWLTWRCGGKKDKWCKIRIQMRYNAPHTTGWFDSRSKAVSN